MTETCLPVDTGKFIDRLSQVRRSASTDEERVAASLFDWEKDVTIARAPGRMDVMGAPRSLQWKTANDLFARTPRKATSERLQRNAGGIADYSG